MIHDHEGQVAQFGECVTCAAATPASLARDRSLAQVAAATPAEWVTAAREAVTRIAASTIEFTTDDVWGLVPPVDEPRAMGPIMVWAAEHRLVEPTDRTVPSIRPEAHARPVRVWRSRTYRPPSMF